MEWHIKKLELLSLDGSSEPQGTRQEKLALLAKCERASFYVYVT